MRYSYLKQLGINFHSNKNQILYGLTGIKLLNAGDMRNIEAITTNIFELFLLSLAVQCNFDISGIIDFRHCCDADLCIFCKIYRSQGDCHKCPYYHNYGDLCWDGSPYSEIKQKLKKDVVIVPQGGFSDIPGIQELVQELLIKFANFKNSHRISGAMRRGALNHKELNNESK